MCIWHSVGRIFHCAIQVCPDFCDVIVILVTNYTTLFVREMACSFRTLYMNVPLRVLRLLARGNVTGSDMGRRAQGIGMSLC
jgi:hypothetical protein